MNNMNKPIHFKGAVYPNVEAMPPDVRAAYEAEYAADNQEVLDMLAEAEDQLQRVGSQPQTLPPAWGGVRPDGSVPVPMEFDSVTNLGSAIRVSGPAEGIIVRFPNFGPPRPHVMVRYHDGLAYHTGGKDVHTLRWEEVMAIESNLTRQAGHHGGSWTDHEYTLLKTNGDKLILDDNLKDVENEAEAIKTAVFALITPPQLQRYQSGMAFTFGPITVQSQNGLQLSGKAYAWNAIQDIRVESGRFKVTLRDGQKHEARVSAIPNIEMLCTMIGFKLRSRPFH